MNKDSVLTFIRSHPAFFRKSASWFDDNWAIVQAFNSKTLAQINSGATHCSAREIIYFLSIHTPAQELDGAFKIGNDNGADLARVFMVVHPHYAGVWEQRRKDSKAFLELIAQKLAQEA